MDKTGREIICGTPTTLAVKGLMMMMMRDGRGRRRRRRRKEKKIMMMTIQVNQTDYVLRLVS